MFNEEEVISLLVEEIEKFRKIRSEKIEVILINDGSKDNTKLILVELLQGLTGYKIINFSRNFGHQIAVTAGLDYAKGDAAIILDADLQDPLHVAGKMIAKWKEGYDVIYGLRKKRKGEGLFKKFTAKFFYRFFRWITDLDIPLDTGDFRLIDRKVIADYQKLTEKEPFVRGLITWLGYNQIGIEYERDQRAAGKTKYPISKMFRLAMRAITSFTDKPLRLATKMGLWIFLGTSIGILWIIIVRLFFESAVVPGWASVLLVIFLIGGIQMLFMGIIGTYLARVYEEVRNRPRYLVSNAQEFESKSSDVR